MNINEHNQIESSESLCPKCRSSLLKSWNELNDDQRMIAELLPTSAEYTGKQRKKHRFCTRCWFESVASNETAT